MVGFRKEDLSETVRENFVGVVVYADYPCNCPICRRGTEKLKNYGRSEQKKIHLIIKPVTTYDKLQHAWYPDSKIIWSNLGGLVVALNDLFGFYPSGRTDKEQWEEVKNFLMGRAFEWVSMKSVDFVSQVTGKEIPSRLPDTLKNARENWFPLREIDNDELKRTYGVDFDEVMEAGKAEVEEIFKEIEAEEELFEEQYSEMDQIGF